MPRLCQVCAHPRRSAIDAVLLLHQQSYRAIVKRYGVPHDAVWRHRRKHLDLDLELSKEIHAIEDYLMYHAEYMLGPRTQIPRLMDTLSRLARSTAIALVCGLLSPAAIQAIRKSLAHYDQYERETTH
jgi:hypothetical protein